MASSSMQYFNEDNLIPLIDDDFDYCNTNSILKPVLMQSDSPNFYRTLSDNDEWITTQKNR